MKNSLLYLCTFCLFSLASCHTSTVVEQQTLFDQLDFKQDKEGNSLVYKDNQLFTGVATTHHSNGKKFTEKSYVNGKEAGAWTVWFNNENKQKSGNIQNDLNEGTFFTWYENGQLKYEQPYSAGKKHGKWLSWYENGVKWTERDFEMDVLNGKVLVWDEKGKLTKEYIYKNNVEIDRQFYFEEGE